MKKVMCIILGLLIFNLLTPKILAYSLPEDSFKISYNDLSLENDENLNLAEIAKTNQYLQKIGEEIISSFKGNSKTIGREKLLNSSAPTILQVSHYFQNGQSWSSNYMLPLKQTIGNSGCALTSFTMVENYLNNSNKNPGKINEELSGHTCPMDWEYAGNYYNLKIHSKTIRQGDNPLDMTSVNNLVVGSLSLGLPVILGMYNSSTTHFVTARGYWLNNNSLIIMINDPNVNKNYTTLEQYLNAGYKVRTYIVYKK